MNSHVEFLSESHRHPVLKKHEQDQNRQMGMGWHKTFGDQSLFISLIRKKPFAGPGVLRFSSGYRVGYIGDGV